MKTKPVTLFIEPSSYERLRLRAFQERVSVSEVVRRAMAAYLLRRTPRRQKKNTA